MWCKEEHWHRNKRFGRHHMNSKQWDEKHIKHTWIKLWSGETAERMWPSEASESSSTSSLFSVSLSAYLLPFQAGHELGENDDGCSLTSLASRGKMLPAAVRLGPPYWRSAARAKRVSFWFKVFKRYCGCVHVQWRTQSLKKTKLLQFHSF